MSALPARVCGGARWRGGILGYPLTALHEEIAYLAYYLHWSYDQLMQMEHAERRQWVSETAKINRRLQPEDGSSSSGSGFEFF